MPPTPKLQDAAETKYLKMSKYTILFVSLVIVGISMGPVYGQSPRPRKKIQTADTTVKSTPVVLAPDSSLKNLSGLIHAGKYEEARQGLTVLLANYPYDDRLIKSKLLLDQLPATSASANTATAGQVQVEAPLKGMDKLEYNSLIQLAKDAQNDTDLDDQKKLLRRYMDESAVFLQKYPGQMLLWELRAASAISLNDPMAGYEAGQRLLAAGGADSNDAQLEQLMVQLKNKQWLDMQEITREVKAQQKEADNIKKLSLFLGTWNVVYDWRAGWHGTGNGSRGKEEFVLEGPYAEGLEINNAGTKLSEPDLRATVLNSGEISWECYLPPTNLGELFYNRWRNGGGYSDWLPYNIVSNNENWYPAGWQKVISCTYPDASTIIIIMPSQNLDPESSTPTNRPVTLTLTKENIRR